MCGRSHLPVHTWGAALLADFHHAWTTEDDSSPDQLTPALADSDGPVDCGLAGDLLDFALVSHGRVFPCQGSSFVWKDGDAGQLRCRRPRPLRYTHPWLRMSDLGNKSFSIPLHPGMV